MAVYKCTALMNITTGLDNPVPRKRAAGVSEGIYTTQSNPNTVQTMFEELCRKRAPLLPVGAVIIGQRYQTVDPVGPASVVNRAFPASSALGCDYPNLSLQMNSKGVGVRNVRRGFIRLMPDIMIKDGEFFPGNDTWMRSLQNYFVALSGWQFRGDDLTVPLVPLVGYTPESSTTEGIVETEEAHGWVAGNIILLQKMQDPESKRFVSYRAKVISTGSTTTALVKLIKATNSGFKQGGRGRKSIPMYHTIAPTGVTGNVFAPSIVQGTIAGKITSKKVGRPFDLFRGHATAKR